MSAARLGRKKKVASQEKVCKIVPKKQSHVRRINKPRFLKALAGSGGLKKTICERLGCSYDAVNNILKRPGWEDIQLAYWEEVEKVADLAEGTIQAAIENRADMTLATQNARWYLERKCRGRGFGKETVLTLEGGEKPLLVSQAAVPVETLDLPLEVKKAILEALERKGSL